MYSMRLFVVCRAPPESSTASPPPGGTTIAAQPPGPGLPRQAPSVHTSASPARAATRASPFVARRVRLRYGADDDTGGDPTTWRGRLSR